MRILTACIFLLFSVQVLASGYPETKIEKINDRVYALLGPYGIPSDKNKGYVNNNLVIVGDNGVILVDAGSHKYAAKHINQSIREITDKPVTHILVTHHHSDHHMGSVYFDDATVIATENCAKHIKNEWRAMRNSMAKRSGVDLDGIEVVVPQQTIAAEERKMMTIHGVNIELISPGVAHTDGDMIIWLPEDKVMASGDILVHMINPNFNDGHLGKWIGVVDNIILNEPFTTILPGHGPLMSREKVMSFRAMIAKFYKTIEKIYLADGDQSEVRGKLDMKKLQSLGRFQPMIGRNISKVWLEIEEDNF